MARDRAEADSALVPSRSGIERGTGGADSGAWSIWVDTGGTFTDCVAIDPAGRTHRAKVLSSSTIRTRVRRVEGPTAIAIESPWKLPDGFFCGSRFRVLAGATDTEVLSYCGEDDLLELANPLAGVSEGDVCELEGAEEAPVLAARLVTSTAAGEALPTAVLRLATTRGTNALLERQGAPVALFISQGLGDLLEIGTQQRPDLFALQVRKKPQLYRSVVEVDGRLGADGNPIRPLDLERVREQAELLLQQGVRRAAVALMHSYRDGRQEREVGDLLARVGFEHVSLSSELAPLVKLLPRAETAVVNAYLSEVMESYLRRVEDCFEGSRAYVMTSAGGLMRSSEFRPKDSLLSGPAGGVVGAVAAARRVGHESVISFDMGGTSTDVARHDRDFDYLFETRVGDARLMAPSLAIETVAAGGGSICAFDGTQLKVGPESAGARPGPACYGAGGPLHAH